MTGDPAARHPLFQEWPSGMAFALLVAPAGRKVQISWYARGRATQARPSRQEQAKKTRKIMILVSQRSCGRCCVCPTANPTHRPQPDTEPEEKDPAPPDIAEVARDIERAAEIFAHSQRATFPPEAISNLRLAVLLLMAIVPHSTLCLLKTLSSARTKA
jgi:hypothetical protein